MKKYIKPQIRLVVVEPVSICAGSLNVDPSQGTNTQYSNDLYMDWEE